MADKSVTIKNATDKELDELITRLRKESEVQNLISEIKRKGSSGYMPYDYGQEVSTEVPIESLYHKADETLTHFGIKGMKWGHRKSGGWSDSKKDKTTSDVSDDYKKSRELKSKSVKNLSNKELKDLNNRLQLEKQLRELKSSDYTKGLEVVKTLTAAGTTVASLYALSTTPLGQAIKKAIIKQH